MRLFVAAFELYSCPALTCFDRYVNGYCVLARLQDIKTH